MSRKKRGFSSGTKKRKTAGVNKLVIAVLFAGFFLALPEIWAAAQNIYYEPTVKKIIETDCGRCHAVASRYLMDYDSLKAAADSGMLGAMVQGSMSRFAGGDARTILSWIESGAQEKPPGKQVNFFFNPDPTGPNQPGCRQGRAPLHVPTGQVTYSNSIKYILAGDCLRCHSGQFRNLTTYENVKMYADNGLLKTLVQLGGPMHRFAGPDSRLIITWIKSGAPK